MGYTTKFKGKFTITPPADLALFNRVNDIDDGTNEPKPHPDSYCQWVISKDGGSLEWDQNEKFYNYTEWLQYVIAEVIAPTGRVVTGHVEYQGEETGDSGTLTIIDGCVHRDKSAPKNEFAKICAWLDSNGHEAAAAKLRTEYRTNRKSA